MFRNCFLAFWGVVALQGWVQAESISATLTKVLDLPVSGSDGGVTSPQDPRGGILQIGQELWFTTYGGGENSVGAIVSYHLLSGNLTTQHSFGLPNPGNPAEARYDGYQPNKTTLTLGADGLVYYAAQYGGASWTNGNNGGAMGAFDPATVQSAGVTPVWSGSVAANAAQNLTYTTPIYVPVSGGGASVYFNTYAGGASNWGTVQKVSLDSGGAPIGVTEITTFTGSNSVPNSGRQPQGGMLLVGDKIYYSTASGAGGALPTLQVLDTTTDTVSVLSTSWTTGGNNGSWTSPIYDSSRNAIYSLALTGGILAWDLETGVVDPQSLLPHSDDGESGNFASPILFGDSIYYVKQARGNTSSDTYGGQIWRYDLESASIELLFNLKDYDGRASSQSGTLSLVKEGGLDVLYFLTAKDLAGDDFGALFKLEVSVVPEPGTLGLAGMGLLLWAMRARRRNR